MSRPLKKILADVMGGTFLSGDSVIKLFPFIMYVVLLLMLNITNTYLAEDMSREIARLNRELEERHVEYIYLKSEITEITKQSNLAIKLKDKGIKESVEPLRLIEVEEEGGEDYGF